MVTYVAGNLFTSPAQVLVNTVNTQGVMGKGIALQFKHTYPEMFKNYQELCERGKIDIGVLWIYKTPHKWVLNFPTKKYWRNPSKAEYIETGLKKLSEKFNELDIYSIAFPALGCGNGELDWEDTVRPLMEKYLTKLPADVFIHPPLSKEELPEHKNKKEIEKWLRSETTTLPFSEVWRDLHELLSRKSRFSTHNTASPFQAKIEESSKKLIEEGNNSFLIIEAKKRTRKIEYNQLRELWQQFRRHGYLRRGIVSNFERELSYLIPIFSELDYVEKIELSETGDFSAIKRIQRFNILPLLEPSNLHFSLYKTIYIEFMKSDSNEIIEFLDNLANEKWLGSVRARWVKYIFHYTDIRNAAKILSSGKLLCRAKLERTGAMAVDNASRVIISSTETDVKNYVRLYFRPKTPTQYNNEGIRPIAEQSLESHCPVPIFFLFDAKVILTRSDCQFAEGNLAKLGIHGFRSTAKELKSFDFNKIYHLGTFNRTERDDIILHRNAEVVIPNELDLSALKFIVCRSPAEKESLLHLLPPSIISRWGSKILVDTKADFYNRSWVFVQTVQLTSKKASFDFSPDALVAEPFILEVARRGYEEKIFRKENFRANKKLMFEFPRDIWKYEIELKLDDNLAFIGSYDGSDEIPF